MANRAQVLVAPVTVLFVDTLRGMTPLDVDTAVGAVFAVCAVVVQIGLFALARAITKALSADSTRAAAENLAARRDARDAGARRTRHGAG